MTLRISRQLHLITKQPPYNCVEVGPPDPNNLFFWQAKIYGPQNTPYQFGIFLIDINIPEDYPTAKPRCRFRTKIYHPNINEQGHISYDHYFCCRGDWSPAQTISSMIQQIYSILANPNSLNPLSIQIANVYLKDRPAFKERAKSWTQKYAE